jgi:hypothetical protein
MSECFFFGECQNVFFKLWLWHGVYVAEIPSIFSALLQENQARCCDVAFIAKGHIALQMSSMESFAK